MSAMPLHPGAPNLGDPNPGDPDLLTSRARALELLGAYSASLPLRERRASVARVADEVGGNPVALAAVLHALAEYAAALADFAAVSTATGDAVPDPGALVRALARVDLRTQ